MWDQTVWAEDIFNRVSVVEARTANALSTLL